MSATDDRRSSSLPRVAVDLRGSGRAAGRAYGERFAAEIARQVAAYEAVFDVLGMGANEVARRVETELLPPAEQVFQGYVDELRGRAEGAGVRFRDLFPLSCIEEVWSWVGPEKLRELEELAQGSGPAGHCTTFALRRDGRVLLGHNEDWSAVDLGTTMPLHDVTAADGTRFLSLQLVGVIPWGGLNSHGLTITANTLPTTDARAGVPNAFVLRRLLECRSLEEVWEHVRLAGRALGGYVLAGDARGRVWAMETSARQACRREVDTWTAETNNFTEESLQELGTRPVSEDSLGRLARAKELIASGWERGDELVDLARAVLADHGGDGGRALCVHADPAVAPALQDATIASIVYEPTARRMWAATGPACESTPEESGLPDEVAAG
jgi:isopenicillin-N N-acyltransferase-like protein